MCTHIHTHICNIHCCCLVSKLCLTLCDPKDCRMPGFPVHHQLSRVCTNSCPLSQWCHPTCCLILPPSPFAFNLSHPQSLFQWVGSSHQLAKLLELPLQHQFFHWFPLGLIGLISCCPRDSQESSPAPRIKSINSSVLILLYMYICVYAHVHICTYTLVYILFLSYKYIDKKVFQNLARILDFAWGCLASVDEREVLVSAVLEDTG